MENVIKYFNNIETSFKRMKNLSMVCIVAALSFAVVAAYLAFDFARASSGRVFLLDKGTALMASAADNDVQRDLEAGDHVARFHDFLFNLSPNADAIKRNVDRALAMSDVSAYNYWRDLSERGYYQRIVSANISQQMIVDSVKVNMQQYPYEAHTYGRIYIVRQSNVTQYAFESRCQLTDVERSQSNPHGMMVEKFTVTRNEAVGTQRRN